MLAETADEAKLVCKATQLCAGLEAGIKGGIACVLKRVSELGGNNFVDGEAEEDGLDGGLGTQPEGNEATTETAAEGVVGSKCGDAEGEGLGTQPLTTPADDDGDNIPDLGQVGNDDLVL